MKNILGNFCFYCAVSAEVHLEQLKSSLGAVDQKFSDEVATLHRLFCEECWLPWLTQCLSGLAMGFKDLNSSAICSSSCFPNISAFCYRVWEYYRLSHVPVSVADTMAPSMARLCTYSLLSFVEFFRYLWPILSLWSQKWSQLLLPPTLQFLYMSVFIHRLLPSPAENSAALPCTYLASWDTSTSALAELCIVFLQDIFCSRHPHSPLWGFLPFYI